MVDGIIYFTLLICTCQEGDMLNLDGHESLFYHGAHLKADHPFFTYCRTAYHLWQGAPGRGSTGVFEGD